MASLNVIHLIGNIGREPEMRYLPNGTACTSFSLAVSDDYKKDEQWVKRTEWFSITTWNKHAEYIAQKYHIGDTIYVEGKIRLRKYQKQDGSEGTSLDVNAQTTKMVAAKNKAANSPFPDNNLQSEPQVEDDPFTAEDSGSDEIPL